MSILAQWSCRLETIALILSCPDVQTVATSYTIQKDHQNRSVFRDAPTANHCFRRLLQLILRNGRMDIFKWLVTLEEGHEVFDNFSVTEALANACTAQSLELFQAVEELYKQRSGQIPFWAKVFGIACEYGCVPIAQYVLEQGVSRGVDVLEDSVHLRVALYDDDIVTLLLKHVQNRFEHAIAEKIHYFPTGLIRGLVEANNAEGLDHLRSLFASLELCPPGNAEALERMLSILEHAFVHGRFEMFCQLVEYMDGGFLTRGGGAGLGDRHDLREELTARLAGMNHHDARHCPKTLYDGLAGFEVENAVFAEGAARNIAPNCSSSQRSPSSSSSGISVPGASADQNKTMALDDGAKVPRDDSPAFLPLIPLFPVKKLSDPFLSSGDESYLLTKNNGGSPLLTPALTRSSRHSASSSASSSTSMVSLASLACSETPALSGSFFTSTIQNDVSAKVSWANASAVATSSAASSTSSSSMATSTSSTSTSTSTSSSSLSTLPASCVGFSTSDSVPRAVITTSEGGSVDSSEAAPCTSLPTWYTRPPLEAQQQQTIDQHTIDRDQLDWMLSSLARRHAFDPLSIVLAFEAAELRGLHHVAAGMAGHPQLGPLLAQHSVGGWSRVQGPAAETGCKAGVNPKVFSVNCFTLRNASPAWTDTMKRTVFAKRIREGTVGTGPIERDVLEKDITLGSVMWLLDQHNWLRAAVTFKSENRLWTYALRPSLNDEHIDAFLRKRLLVKEKTSIKSYFVGEGEDKDGDEGTGQREPKVHNEEVDAVLMRESYVASASSSARGSTSSSSASMSFSSNTGISTTSSTATPSLTPKVAVAGPEMAALIQMDALQTDRVLGLLVRRGLVDPAEPLAAAIANNSSLSSSSSASTSSSSSSLSLSLSVPTGPSAIYVIPFDVEQGVRQPTAGKVLYWLSRLHHWDTYCSAAVSLPPPPPSPTQPPSPTSTSTSALSSRSSSTSSTLSSSSPASLSSIVTRVKGWLGVGSRLATAKRELAHAILHGLHACLVPTRIDTEAAEAFLNAWMRHHPAAATGRSRRSAEELTTAQIVGAILCSLNACTTRHLLRLFFEPEVAEGRVLSRLPRRQQKPQQRQQQKKKSAVRPSVTLPAALLASAESPRSRGFLSREDVSAAVGLAILRLRAANVPAHRIAHWVHVWVHEMGAPATRDLGIHDPKPVLVRLRLPAAPQSVWSRDREPAGPPMGEVDGDVATGYSNGHSATVMETRYADTALMLLAETAQAPPREAVWPAAGTTTVLAAASRTSDDDAHALTNVRAYAYACTLSARFLEDDAEHTSAVYMLHLIEAIAQDVDDSGSSF